MENNTFNRLLDEAAQELRQEKLILIEDIIKSKRLLFGMGIEEYRPVIDDPAAEFDKLYDKTINQLQGIDRIMTAWLNETMIQKLKKPCG